MTIFNSYEALAAHNSAREKNNSAVTYFKGYIQWGIIKDAHHSTVGYTPDEIRKCAEIINHPAYLYARQSSGWISIFHKSEQSPTGVLNVGGIPNELEFLLPLFGKTSQLSPTEDLRSAK